MVRVVSGAHIVVNAVCEWNPRIISGNVLELCSSQTCKGNVQSRQRTTEPYRVTSGLNYKQMFCYTTVDYSKYLAGQHNGMASTSVLHHFLFPWWFLNGPAQSCVCVWLSWQYHWIDHVYSYKLLRFLGLIKWLFIIPCTYPVSAIPCVHKCVCAGACMLSAEVYDFSKC